jgi:uncharacterized protein YbbK (DUF523 family)
VKRITEDKSIHEIVKILSTKYLTSTAMTKLENLVRLRTERHN